MDWYATRVASGVKHALSRTSFLIPSHVSSLLLALLIDPVDLFDPI